MPEIKHRRLHVSLNSSELSARGSFCMEGSRRPAALDRNGKQKTGSLFDFRFLVVGRRIELLLRD